MLGSFTAYLAVGIIAGLVGFMFLFSKYDFPGYIKKRFKLYDKYKSIGFALCVGVVLAVSSSFILSALKLGPVPTQIIEGAAIGLNCAILVGLMNKKGGNYDKGPGKAKKTADNKGRRSKG